MADLNAAVADNHRAVDEFIAAARSVIPAQWNVPRAEGKWSSAQVVEHIALAYEYSLAVLENRASGPKAPRFIRPLVRAFFVNPTLRAGRFTRKGKTLSMFEPSSAPADQATSIRRVESALTAFEAGLRAADASGRTTLDHPFFGTMALTDYVRLQAIHARHHRAQLAGAAAVA
jgi:uncharacterized damage-inducible protein DinB